jgi:20S proteasome alpha/beta subunit
MTLCIAVRCEDGILIASDSRTVYGRGVPISRDTNKIHILEKEGLVGKKVALVGAGTVAFIDKFVRMFMNTDLVKIAEEE